MGDKKNNTEKKSIESNIIFNTWNQMNKMGVKEKRITLYSVLSSELELSESRAQHPIQYNSLYYNSITDIEQTLKTIYRLTRVLTKPRNVANQTNKQKLITVSYKNNPDTLNSNQTFMSDPQCSNVLG